jgi:hypothetical protein
MVFNPCQRIHADAANFAPRVNLIDDVAPATAPRRKRLSYTRRTITQTDVAVARAGVAELC